MLKKSYTWEFIASESFTMGDVADLYSFTKILGENNSYRKILVSYHTDYYYSWVQFFWRWGTMGGTAPLFFNQQDPLNNGKEKANCLILFEKLEGLGWRITQSCSTNDSYGNIGMKNNSVIQNNIGSSQNEFIYKLTFHFTDYNNIAQKGTSIDCEIWGVRDF